MAKLRGAEQRHGICSTIRFDVDNTRHVQLRDALPKKVELPHLPNSIEYGVQPAEDAARERTLPFDDDPLEQAMRLDVRPVDDAAGTRSSMVAQQNRSDLTRSIVETMLKERIGPDGDLAEVPNVKIVYPVPMQLVLLSSTRRAGVESNARLAR